MNKIMGFASGFVLVIAGTAITFSQWENLAILIRAFAGPVIAVAGLVVLFVFSSKKK